MAPLSRTLLPTTTKKVKRDTEKEYFRVVRTAIVDYSGGNFKREKGGMRQGENIY